MGMPTLVEKQPASTGSGANTDAGMSRREMDFRYGT
jgi:hypothetical protein